MTAPFGRSWGLVRWPLAVAKWPVGFQTYIVSIKRSRCQGLRGRLWWARPVGGRGRSVRRWSLFVRRPYGSFWFRCRWRRWRRSWCYRCRGSVRGGGAERVLHCVCLAIGGRGAIAVQISSSSRSLLPTRSRGRRRLWRRERRRYCTCEYFGCVARRRWGVRAG